MMAILARIELALATKVGVNSDLGVGPGESQVSKKWEGSLVNLAEGT